MLLIMRNLILVFSCILFFPGVSLAQLEKNTEISQDERTVAAKEVLSQSENLLTVYVKGLCCPSCAIGIRKYVTQLDFVDASQLKKGVALDTKTQLATIALKEDKEPDVTSLAKAIRDAGYDPFHLYQIKDGKLETTVFPEK